MFIRIHSKHWMLHIVIVQQQNLWKKPQEDLRMTLALSGGRFVTAAAWTRISPSTDFYFCELRTRRDDAGSLPACPAAAPTHGEEVKLQPLTHMWPDGFKSTANTRASSHESARKVRVFALRSVTCVFIWPEARGGKRAEVSVCWWQQMLTLLAASHS